MSWQVILVSAVTALILAYLYLFMIRLVGGIIIYISIVLIIIGLTGGGLYAFFKADDYDTEDPFHSYVTWAAYVIWGIDVLVILSVLCCFHAIKIGIAVFKTTA